MKNIVFMTALLSACILASCGDADISPNNAPDITGITTTTPSSIEESSAAEELPSQSEADASEQESNSTPETSGDDTGTEDDPYTKLLASVDRDYQFVQADGETVTFGDLLNEGYANITAEGCGYCLVKSGGGAGSLFFGVRYTENGGESFSDGGFVSLRNGEIRFFRIEDGRLLVFDRAAAGEGETTAIVMTFENNEVKTQEYQQYFDGIILDDGTELAPTSPVSVEGKYLGGYKLRLIMTDDETDEFLLDTDVELDSVTLELVLPDAAE